MITLRVGLLYSSFISLLILISFYDINMKLVLGNRVDTFWGRETIGLSKILSVCAIWLVYFGLQGGVSTLTLGHCFQLNP